VILLYTCHSSASDFEFGLYANLDLAGGNAICYFVFIGSRKHWVSSCHGLLFSNSRANNANKLLRLSLLIIQKSGVSGKNTACEVKYQELLATRGFTLKRRTTAITVIGKKYSQRTKNLI
jgi:hypothetical protein